LAPFAKFDLGAWPTYSDVAGLGRAGWKRHVLKAAREARLA
jgi:hypothetical protein